MRKLSARAAADAAWVEECAPVGTPWVSGAFRPNREQELIDIGVFIRTGPDTFVVGRRYAAPGTTRWVEGTVADLRAGDRVSGDEDALDAVRGTGDLAYGDINWTLIQREARLVLRVERGFGEMLVYVAGEPDPIRTVVDATLVREVAA